MAKRIQRQRTKGWKMPEGAVYVGRPTKWGNPNRVGEYSWWLNREIESREEAVRLFRLAGPWATGANRGSLAAVEELRGKDLVCWCPLDEPCHADVLLEWANEEALDA